MAGNAKTPDTSAKETSKKGSPVIWDKVSDFFLDWKSFDTAPPKKQPAGTAQAGPSPLHPLDHDGDGDVDMDDMIAMADADVEGEAVDTVVHMSSHYPIFVVTVCIVGIAFWMAGVAWTTWETAETWDDMFYVLGGLESFLPGLTMVLNHGDDCQDYRFEAWRWIIYQFSHSGVSHIFMNVLLTLVAGIPLEGFHGHIRIAVVFNVSVIGGALCHMVSYTHASGLVGMSAGCYSLMAMHMADLAMNWTQNRWRYVKLLMLLLLIVVDVVLAQVGSPDDGKGHSAHLGGYLAGLIFGIFMVRNVKITPAERVAQGIMLFIGLGLLIFALIWIAQWAPRSVWGEEPYCGTMQILKMNVGWDAWKCVACTEPQCGGIYDNSLEFKKAPMSTVDCRILGMEWYN